jgi:signal transduction histidine kinase
VSASVDTRASGSGRTDDPAAADQLTFDRMLPSAEPPYPGWRRPDPGPDGFRFDLAAAIALCAAALITTPLYGWSGMVGSHDHPLWLELLWSAACTLPIGWRRRYPNIVAIIVSAAFLAGGIAFGVSLFFQNIALFVSFYTVGAWGPDRQRARWTRLAITGSMFIWLLVAIFMYATGDGPDEMPAATGPFSPLVALAMIQLLTNATFFAGAYYLGNRGFAQAIEQHALVRRTEELARMRERTAEQAVALERMRIARELHDVVAHHVSVMGVQASAARMALDQNPDAARTALGNVESSARSAIDELHTMLSTLRTDPADDPAERPDNAAPTVGVRRLPELVEQADAAGVPTRLEIIGTARPLPAVIDVNVYRIAQEALTNVRKHAGPYATADVRLRYFDDEVELEIANSGRSVTSTGGSRRGLGQVGMRERVAASGGWIELGPLRRGGYLVRARLPLRSDRQVETQT